MERRRILARIEIAVLSRRVRRIRRKPDASHLLCLLYASVEHQIEHVWTDWASKNKTPLKACPSPLHRQVLRLLDEQVRDYYDDGTLPDPHALEAHRDVFIAPRCCHPAGATSPCRPSMFRLAGHSKLAN